MANTPRKTFPELQALSAPVVDSDVVAVYRAPGPAKRTTASVLKTYAQTGLGTMATQNANAVAITGGSITGITDLAVADGGTGAGTADGALTNLGGTTVGKAVFTAADAAAARTATGTVIGTDVQAYDADLAAIAALTSAADKMPYATGAQTWALADLTAAGRALLDDADAAAQRTTLAAVGTAELAASTGAALVGSIGSGMGATSRTAQAKFRDFVSVKDFGAVGDGVTDDAPAFNAALAASVGGLAGKAVYVPGSNARYVIGSTIVVPGGARLFGDGARSSSFLIKAFNGTFITLDDGAQLWGLRMDGAGATRTGKGIEHIGGNQVVRDLFIYDTADTTVYFSVTSGANCHYENVTAWMYNSTSGSGRWAFKIEDSASAPAGTPRNFINIKTGGFESFYFGASNNTLISSSALFDLGWPVYSLGVKEFSRNVEITGCRIGSTAQLDIYGTGTIIGCDIGSKVSLKEPTAICLGPNLYNASWEDLSTSGTNLVYSVEDIIYTPICYAAGVAITLGNGTLVGRYSREGRTLTVTIRLLPGATTVFGAGQLSFSLPMATTAGLAQQGIQGRFEATSGTLYRINGRIASGGSVVLLERDTTGAVTATAPGTMAVTGQIIMTVVYDI